MKYTLAIIATFLLSSSIAAAAPTVTGTTISWPDDGLYQVQIVNDDGIFEVCQGGRSCAVSQGEYIVINHSTGERFKNIFVPSGMTPEQITVTGNVISWPDDGWYQVQRSDTYESVCSGTTSCDVGPGNYIVINHTTGVRYKDVLVGIVSDPIMVSGRTISWPDDGWYQVQTSDTYESVCNGGESCDVPDGTYTVINHTSGERYRNIQVPSSQQGSEIIDYRVIASGDLAFTENLTFALPRYQVITSRVALNELYFDGLLSPCEDCDLQPLPFVDFAESVVVLVAHEIVNSGGYDINIDSVSLGSDRLTINVEKLSPGNNCPVDTGFTGPFKLYEIVGQYDDIDFVENSVFAPSC